MLTGQHDQAIDVWGLGKRFGTRWVLRGVTLAVRAGETVGLLGPNGSGKSTVLRIVGTLIKASVGTAAVNGLDVTRDGAAVRAQIGYLSHTPGLYDDLTARENLTFAADMLGLSHAAVDAPLERVGLAHVADDRVRGFSAGMQRRLALARLVLRNPRVLLLDEPYANLDAEGVELMNSVIATIVNSGGAALVALHELAPARAMLGRTCTLIAGRIGDARPEGAGHDAPTSVSGAR